MTHRPATLALDAFLTRYLNRVKDANGHLPTVEFDPPWPSPCTELADNASDDIVRNWRPVERHDYDLFSSLEKALELDFHPDIKSFYGSYWSNGVCAIHQSLHFNLIQIWNEEDETNLKENMLGHAFAKIKARLPLTFFIGCTDGNDIISLDQDSGAIVLEKPGYRAHQTLAPSLENFLLDLEPSLDTYS